MDVDQTDQDSIQLPVYREVHGPAIYLPHNFAADVGLRDRQRLGSSATRDDALMDEETDEEALQAELSDEEALNQKDEALEKQFSEHLWNASWSAKH
jgi:hypothetical protein